MGSPWAIIQSANIHGSGKSRKIRVPSELKDRVFYTHRVKSKGECVEWHLDEYANVAVVAPVELENDRYISFGETTLHDHSNSITPPKKLLDSICEVLPDFRGADQLFPSGGTALYIAPHQMIYEVPYASYVLSSRRLFQMIDEDSTQEFSLSQLMQSLPEKA
ncbi:hypothetical protein [Halococcus sediminicola]|uniref:hypothetical protein n=1 Tax=Halococcus sediminicola TaxID=1264579 RepID=UPI000678EBF5|nr:hypothetical protein [Halococcus sediminicola]